MVNQQVSDILYPILIVVGVFFALLSLEKFFKVCKLKKGTSTDYELCLTISVAFGIISAILFQNLYNLIQNPSSFKFSWGMTFYGGLIGGVACFFLTYLIYLRKKYPTSLPYALTIAGGAIPLAHAFGRVGCFFAGCCYGKTVDSSSPFYWMGVKFLTTDTKVIPTNLIEAIFLFILAGVLLFVAFKKKTRLTFPLYFMIYGVFRFSLEFLRGDYRGSFIPNLTPSQFWAILLFVLGLIHLIYLIVKKKIYLNVKEENIVEEVKA